MAKDRTIHHFDWGNGRDKVEIHFPRQIKQIPSIEQAVKEGYIPYQMRVHPIGERGFKPWGVDNVRNTCKGYSAILKLDELDVPSSARAYVPSGIMWEDVDISRQMIIEFLYFKKE